MKKIPGPKTPKLWQMLQWIGDPIKSMETGQREYGEVYRWARSPSTHTIFVSNPQALRQIFTNENDQFAALGNKLMEPLVGVNSLLTLSGDRHEQQRKLIMPPFHGERMRNYGNLVIDIIRQEMDQIPIGKPFIARVVMQSVSMQVILKAVFGVHEGERYERLKKELGTILNRFESPLVATLLFLPALQKHFKSWWSPWKNFLKQKKAIDRILYTEIAERRQQNTENRSDILSLLISAIDENGERMSDVELRDELITLLAAGYDTTTLAISWALYWIYSQPGIKDKSQAELESAGPLEPLALVKLPYLNAVCDESLRLYPVAYVTLPRQVRRPVKVLDYELPVGSSLVGATYLVHHNESLYPNPKQFKPERFLERKFSSWEFLPFGGGTRRCVGAALAQYEMKLVLATILSNYQLELVEKQPVKPCRRALNLAPKGGVKLRRC